MYVQVCATELFEVKFRCTSLKFIPTTSVVGVITHYTVKYRKIECPRFWCWLVRFYVNVYICLRKWYRNSRREVHVLRFDVDHILVGWIFPKVWAYRIVMGGMLILFQILIFIYSCLCLCYLYTVYTYFFLPKEKMMIRSSKRLVINTWLSLFT